LYDAAERRVYAAYLWISGTKKYWEVPPSQCELTPSYTEKRFCKTEDEFNAFIAEYMEN
jgi:hypothetical protein